MCDWRCWFENGSAPPQMLSLWDTITFAHPDLISEKSKLWPSFSSYSFYSNWIQSNALFSLLWHLCWKRKKKICSHAYIQIFSSYDPYAVSRSILAKSSLPWHAVLGFARFIIKDAMGWKGGFWVILLQSIWPFSYCIY